MTQGTRRRSRRVSTSSLALALGSCGELLWFVPWHAQLSECSSQAAFGVLLLVCRTSANATNNLVRVPRSCQAAFGSDLEMENVIRGASVFDFALGETVRRHYCTGHCTLVDLMAIVRRHLTFGVALVSSTATPSTCRERDA